MTAMPVQSATKHQSLPTGWSEIPIPQGVGVIGDCDFVSPDDGWALDWTYDQVLHWDGSSWQIAPGPKGLQQIKMISAESGWAVGVRYKKDTVYLEGVLAKWNGKAWTELPFPYDLRITPRDPDFMIVSDLIFLSSDQGWIVGGSEWQYPERTLDERFIFAWDGHSWKRENYPKVKEGSVNFYFTSMLMLSRTEGWLAAAGARLYYWDGKRWKEYIQADGLGAVEITSFSSLTSGKVWFAGSDLSIDYKGVGIISYWDGNTWKEQYRKEGEAVHSLVMIDPDSGWALQGRSILRWDGSTWNEYYRSEEHEFKTLCALSGKNIWAMGGWVSHADGQGYLLHYEGSVPPSIYPNPLTPSSIIPTPLRLSQTPSFTVPPVLATPFLLSTTVKTPIKIENQTSRSLSAYLIFPIVLGAVILLFFVMFRKRNE